MLKDLAIMMPRFGRNLRDQSRAGFKKAKQIAGSISRTPTPANSAIPSSRVDKVLTEDILILELPPTTLSNWSGDKEAFKGRRRRDGDRYEQGPSEMHCSFLNVLAWAGVMKSCVILLTSFSLEHVRGARYAQDSTLTSLLPL
jgi:hypothetical protein